MGDVRKQYMNESITAYQNALKYYGIKTKRFSESHGLGTRAFLNSYTDACGDLQYGIGLALVELGNMEDQGHAFYKQAADAFLKAQLGWLDQNTQKYMNSNYYLAKRAVCKTSGGQVKAPPLDLRSIPRLNVTRKGKLYISQRGWLYYSTTHEPVKVR